MGIINKAVDLVKFKGLKPKMPHGKTISDDTFQKLKTNFQWLIVSEAEDEVRMNIGIKHGFHALTFARSRGRC